MDIYKNATDTFYLRKPRDLGIYIHIPFCVKKCDYCDFLSAPASEEVKHQYIRALITEIESYRGRMEEYVVPTIFFGGGTPSSIEADGIHQIMKSISSVFQLDRNRLEVTIEVNPGTITEDKLQVYKDAGINRLSFGLQSVNNKELKLIGRIHTYEEFYKNYNMARNMGFTNINIDLMSALPGQSIKSWENTLKTVIDLAPEHISAYSLIIEEGTKFYEHYREGADCFADLPDEDTDRLMYHRTKELLKMHGYERYEISNYAKSDYKCAHNCTYWNGTEYLGFGLGASSLLNGARYSILHDIKQYIQLCAEFNHKSIARIGEDMVENRMGSCLDNPIGLIKDHDILTVQQRMEEFMFLGLRMCSGISQKAFLQRFGTNINLIYEPVLQKLMKQKLITISGDNIRLTDYGIDISNSVLSEFLLYES